MEVYFASSRVKDFRQWWVPKESLLEKMERLFFSASLDKIIVKGGSVGIKVHFGEPGDVHYIRPAYVSRAVDIIKGLEASPVIVETAGLGWRPGRTSAKKHLLAARKNGFCEETLGAPIVMADGDDGLDSSGGDVPVAKGIAELDSLIVLSHATGHIQAGFGGAIKNLGVGCVTKTGKFRVHFDGVPKIKDELCDMCNECVEVCPVDAVHPPVINETACLLCNACLDVCDRRAIEVKMIDPMTLSERIAENAKGAVDALGENIGYINLLVDIIPHCDCHPHSDIPIVPDIGVLASKDPVAIDTASVDLINEAPGINGSAFEGGSADKFSSINPATNWRTQIETAEKLGIGRMEYRLIQ
ncbi:MAG: DUF362 domain-containing protein [Candidatus Hydrothermarchaeaceae archaeon]